MNEAVARYARIKALFHAALDLPANERAASLLAAEPDDATLREEVMRLLEVESERTEPVFQSPVLTPTMPQTLTGERAYRLLSELGTGGMGQVFLAERAEGEFRQRVAIKFSRLGSADADLLRRFRAERQILARLDHPNIARLLDGGATPEGAPFLVMEYVDGERVDDYCERLKFDARMRVALFVKVCRATQAAHQALIVHRDLKPENILVDVHGEPKLLDFGIAKLLGGDTEDVAQTQTCQGAELLTLRYASPEQVRGDVATTSADIYALGVVLYELLTGRSPYALHSANTTELMRSIADLEPVRPSAAVRAVPDAIPGVGFDFGRLAGDLHGDLDAIVLKCLRKEPNSRYSSAAELADDLERYLARQPVRAHRGSAIYRARKFVARHTAAVVGVAAFLLLLLVSVVALSVQLERTRIERDKSQRIAAFLVDLIAQADPSRSSGETITVREALARGNTRLSHDTALPEDTRALLRSTMGGALHQIGLYSMAESLLSQAAEYYEGSAVGGAEQVEAISLLSNTRLELGKLPEAAELADRALMLARPLADSDPALLGRVAYRSGIVRLRQGRRDEARAAFETSRAAWASAGKSESPESAEALNGLANWARDSGDARAAEDYFRQALALIRKGVRNDWAEARSLNNLAVLRLDQSDLDGAERLMREALVPMKQVLGEEHPVVAGALSNLGGVLNRRGKFDEAAQVFDTSVALRQKLLGEEHPITASTVSNRAWNDYSRGDFALAEDSMRAALAVQMKALGAAHQHTLITQRNLAVVRFARGDLEGAQRLYADMLATARGAMGEEHPLVWVSRERSALITALLGDPAAARAELEKVLSAQEAKLGPAHLETAETRIALALSLLLAHERPTGCQAATQGSADFDRHLGVGHPDRLLGESLLRICNGIEDKVQPEAALRQRYGDAHPLIRALRAIPVRKEI